jgi:hypothetical protein
MPIKLSNETLSSVFVIFSGCNFVKAADGSAILAEFRNNSKASHLVVQSELKKCDEIFIGRNS